MITAIPANKSEVFFLSLRIPSILFFSADRNEVLPARDGIPDSRV